MSFDTYIMHAGPPWPT